jgi:hypothetical protein
MGGAPRLGSAKKEKAAQRARLADERYLHVIACAPGAARLDVGVAVSK